MTSGGNDFNDFPAIQLNKFRANTANTAELITCPHLYTDLPRNKSAL